MNKYLRNGLIYLLLGIALCAFGYYLMDREIMLYKVVMAVGFIIFGVGFLTIIYSLLRKIERRSFERSRRERQGQDDG